MILLGDAKKAREWADYAFNAAQEQQIPHWSAFTKGSQGRLMVDAGRPDDAISQISDAMSDWREAGWGTFRPVFQAHLIDAYLASSKPEEALEIADLALETIAENGEKQFESLVLACQGDALLLVDELRRAEKCYEKGIEIARAQFAKFWELRACTRLARLWQSKGKIHDAQKLLAPIFGWFTEGMDAADIKDAKALLDELR